MENNSPAHVPGTPKISLSAFQIPIKLSEPSSAEHLGDLYNYLCEELVNSPIKEVVLGADEGIGYRHVQALIQLPLLRYLELIRLGKDLQFLLFYTKDTLKKLYVNYDHLSPEEVIQSIRMI
ncbi:hypothetical protein BY996DRAFT_6411554 [Phakopsora pachyrhizi]|nr:hypothetical protein BY996DRAFT_6411554 [Phakopsora pachyrhizi]